MKKHKHEFAFVDYGQLLPRDPNYGLSVECYACGTQHKALGFAHVQSGQSFAVPLCTSCFDATTYVMQNFLEAWSVEFKAIALTKEQAMAWVDKLDNTEH